MIYHSDDTSVSDDAWRSPRDLPGTSRLEEAGESPLTHALLREPVMAEGDYRGSAVFPRESALVLQYLPSGLCQVLTLRQPEVLGRMSDTMSQPIVKAQRHGVSREHCRLRREGQTLLITDLGSLNGTTLNGQRLQAHRDYPLADGDELALGTLHVTIHFSAPDKP